MLALACLSPAMADFLPVVGHKKAVDVDGLVTLQRDNIVCFYSQSNTIARSLYPGLQNLGEKSGPKLDLHMVDVGDLRSATAKKYDLKSLPYFRIYNKDGFLIDEGPSAYKKVTAMIQAKRP